MSQAGGGLRGQGFPVIFAAPSGTGKTTVAQRLRERRSDVVFSVSATTRAPRGYEADGVHYHFVAEAEFARMIAEGELVEWAEVHGNRYGTPLENLRAAAAAGAHLLLDIDIAGAQQVRQRVPEAVAIFILPPSGWALAERLIGRASEPEPVRLRRLRNALAEMRAALGFDYVLVNQEVEETVRAVERILAAERCRPRRMPGLGAEVERLCGEIGDYLQQHHHSLTEAEETQ